MPKNILIAPLDWGLGHTARCIPIIRYLKSLGHVPIIAGNPSQRLFIEQSLGGIETIHIDGYNVTYSKWNKWAQMGLLSQMPRIGKSINAEQKWLHDLCLHRKIDGVISDNRYGLHHPEIPSVIMTHQLGVMSGFGDAVNRTVQKIHFKMLRHFNAAWVVDTPDAPGLGGRLSHTSLPRGAKYIGLLSRFASTASDIAPLTSEVSDKVDTLLILLSGPEPQRSALSVVLWKQALGYSGRVVFVEGSECAVPPVYIPDHIAYHQRLTDAALAPLLSNAAMVICRSGYSTIMDLVALRKKAILIPTPGQTEQEYLGKYLNEQGVFYSASQKGFDLNKELKKAQDFPYRSLPLQQAYSSYKNVVDNWLETL